MPAPLAMLVVYVAIMIICRFALADIRFVRDHTLAVMSTALYVMNWTQALDIGTGGYLVHTSRVVARYCADEYMFQLKTLLATASLTLAVAAASYHALELPMLRMGWRFRQEEWSHTYGVQ